MATKAKAKKRTAKRSPRTRAKSNGKMDTRVLRTIQESVDKGATTAEEIHRAIADLPLEVLERTDLFGKTAGQIRDVQDKAIGAIYDLIRDVNKRVGTLSTELLEKVSA